MTVRAEQTRWSTIGSPSSQIFPREVGDGVYKGPGRTLKTQELETSGRDSVAGELEMDLAHETLGRGKGGQLMVVDALQSSKRMSEAGGDYGVTKRAHWA